ncbi:MAG: helix-turn-helix domain-containing protein [Bdellovibrionota bacterium]
MKKKKKSIEADLLKAMEEVLAYSQGKIKLKETLRELPGPAPRWTAKKIYELRKGVYQMSQTEFALLLNVGTPTVRSWEQGQKTPSGSAARLLEVLSIDKTIMTKLTAS